MASLKKRLHDCESGTVLIEAAISLPLLLLVVLGIADFGRLFQQYEVLTNAAREGARVAVLPDYMDADAIARVNQYLTAGGLDSSVATVPTPTTTAVVVGGAGGPCITLKTVTVTYPHTFSFVGGIVQFFGGTAFGTTTLTATASMRVEGAALSCGP
jgi:Flp pilus assembly protein TadG